MRPLNLRNPRRAQARPDPAPSRWAYRLNRMWLTRRFRFLVRVGVPAALVAAGIGLWLGDEGRRGAIAGAYAELRDAFHHRPEFMVNLVSIEGASGVLADSIRNGLGLDLPLSSFRLDLEAARARVEAFDAVARADLRIGSGGVLHVVVTERLPRIVWRAPDGLWLLDGEGHRIATLTARSLRPDLPLIAGEGADAAVPEALALLRASGPLAPRLRGLARVGARRWDVVLDRDQRIMLPETAPVRVLERVIALDQAQDLFGRDISTVDFRVAARPTVRLTPDGLEALRQVRTISAGASLP